MMAFVCKILTCKSNKVEGNKVEVQNSKNKKQKDNNSEFKQVRKKKNLNHKEVIETLEDIYRTVKFTVEPNFRYIIPSQWMIKIIDMIKLEDYSEVPYIENIIFIGKNRSKIKRDVLLKDLCLVTREIMNLLSEAFSVDFVIQIPYVIAEFKIKLREIVVFTGDEFLKKKMPKIQNLDENDNLDKGILFCSDPKIKSDDYQNEDSNEEEKEENNKVKMSRENKEENIIRIENIKKNKNFAEIKNSYNKYEVNISYDNQQKEYENQNGSSNSKANNFSSTTNKTNSNSTAVTKKSANTSCIIKLDEFQSKVLDPKGLHNPSVYCFMNTCLQCLLSIPELNQYFSNEGFKADKKTKNNTAACYVMKEFIDYYQDSSGSIKAPKSMYKMCHSFLEPNQQHDCQEFLRKVLSKIQEELNFKKKYTFPDKITYENAWKIYRDINPSFVDSIFTGLMRSSVICNKCSYKSDTYDPFQDLSVPIKKKSVESLDNCLENYFSKEYIDCEYKCSNCKKKTSITKNLEIVISPPILTIHIKRFEDLHHKFNGAIEFTEKLDLKTYTSKEVNDSLIYELFAVAVHLGRSIFSGHYVAYAKRNGRWYNFNDSSIFKASIDEALSNNAYVLFYRRIE